MLSLAPPTAQTMCAILVGVLTTVNTNAWGAQFTAKFETDSNLHGFVIQTEAQEGINQSLWACTYMTPWLVPQKPLSGLDIYGQ